MKFSFQDNRINVFAFIGRRDVRAYILALGLIFMAGLFIFFWISWDVMAGINISYDKKQHFWAGQIITASIFMVTYIAIIARVMMAGKEESSFTTLFIWIPALISVGMICAVFLACFVAAGKEIFDIGGSGVPDFQDLKYTIKGALQVTIPISVIIALTPIFIPFNMMMQLPKLRYKNRKKEKAYFRKIQKLESYAMIDMDTQIANRRFFDLYCERAWQSALRDGQSLGLIIVEICGLRKFIRRHGRKKGGLLLKKLAEAVKTFGKRSKDLTARFDDQRFAMLLFDIREPDIIRIAEDMRQTLAFFKENEPSLKNEDAIEFCFGVSAFKPENSRPDPSFVNRATDRLSQSSQCK